MISAEVVSPDAFWGDVSGDLGGDVEKQSRSGFSGPRLLLIVDPFWPIGSSFRGLPCNPWSKRRGFAGDGVVGSLD